MNQIEKVIKETAIEQSTAISLRNSFVPLFDKANEIASAARQIKVTDVTQKDLMKSAREARLQLKSIRVQADATRKALKEDSLRYGRAVQGVYNVIEYLIAPIEEYLEEQEKFVEIQAQREFEARRLLREADLNPYIDFLPSGIDWASMADDDFVKLLNSMKATKEMSEKQQAEAEAERIRLKAEEDAKIAKLKAELEEEKQRAKNELDKKISAEKKLREQQRDAEIARQKMLRAELELHAEKIKREVEEKKRAEREAELVAEKLRLAEQQKKIDIDLSKRKSSLFNVVVEVVKTYFRDDIETANACAHAIVEKLFEIKAKQK